MKSVHFGLFAALIPSVVGTLAAGCSSSPNELASTPSPDQISSDDDPSIVSPGAATLLSEVVTAADLHQSFGTPDDKIPYPDTYWPFTDDGIDAHWNASDVASPLEKFMKLADASHADVAKAWEHTNHGSGVPMVQDWFGHCPGWTAAAMLNSPILHAVTAKIEGGKVVDCAPPSMNASATDGGAEAGATTGNGAEAGATTDGGAPVPDTACQKFEIGDIDALLAESHVDGASRFIGNRCDTKPEDIKRDAFGRIERNGGGCQGLNAGALMIVLADRMKKQHLPVAIDAQNDENTDQIWNQPAYRYTVNRYTAFTSVHAANLVATGKVEGDQTKYQWNENAHGFVLVDVTIDWVAERGPNLVPVSGARSTRHTRFVAILELDHAASNPAAKIIGGEYLDDPSTGADRLTVPPFVWVAEGPGPELLATSVGGRHHNPYVTPSLVAELAALGQK